MCVVLGAGTAISRPLVANRSEAVHRWGGGGDYVGGGVSVLIHSRPSVPAARENKERWVAVTQRIRRNAFRGAASDRSACSSLAARQQFAFWERGVRPPLMVRRMLTSNSTGRSFPT